MDWNEKIDRLIISDSWLVRLTDKKGRLDFPNRLPFCTDAHCTERNCIFYKLYIYIKYSGRLLGNENDIAIGKCIKLIPYFYFPFIWNDIDCYSKEYYESSILPVILKFYEEGFMSRLFEFIKPKRIKIEEI